MVRQFNMIRIVMSNRLNPVRIYAALGEFAGGKSYKRVDAKTAGTEAKQSVGVGSVKCLHLARSKVSYHWDF